MTHEDYMRQALDLARQAAAAGEVPVGCVIVKDGQIIGRGRNRREEDNDPSGHAEMAAIRDACRTIGDWRLTGTRLYVTLEPCPMCAGGIISARIPEVYYGAKDAGFGACGSILNLFEENFRHHPKLVGHILEDQCAALLGGFFSEVRQPPPRSWGALDPRHDQQSTPAPGTQPTDHHPTPHGTTEARAPERSGGPGAQPPRPTGRSPERSEGAPTAGDTTHPGRTEARRGGHH